MRSRFVLAFLPLAALALIVPAACGSSGGDDTTGNSGSGGSGAGGSNGICLLHNCTADAECSSCDGGRTKCLLSEKRCVACDSQTSTGCPSGDYCTSWGNCAPNGVTCPTDTQGTPTITCATNDDCVACDPAHQICDTTQSICVACTADDKSQCQSTDTCSNAACVPACPATCTSDADCAECGGPNAPAHACNAHKCSECSPTITCSDSTDTCSTKGTCGKLCGTDGLGACASDGDCANCSGSATTCHPPLNGGDGKCGPSAPGCSDLGSGVIVLPDPFDNITNLCSSDADCENVSASLNVGKVLRDLTGIDGIGDATIDYPMHACADITVGSSATSVSCGVCVPCREDSDCEDIDIDKLAGEAFGPIGSIAAAFLLDAVFGPDAHIVHMYCETVAGDYGICLPCPGFLNACGYSSDPGTGSCAHDVCTTGDPLNGTCDACSKRICMIDGYCCDTEWDDSCVAEATDDCGASCGGPGCDHSECTAGTPLPVTCSACTQTVCMTDAYCCMMQWDAVCVAAAQSDCGLSCP